MERKFLVPLIAFFAALQIVSAQQTPPSAQQPPAPAPAGQTPAPPAQPQDQQPRPPVIRRGINFVRVDVIVTDGKGNPVLDLKPEDFEVLEDNAPQKVESFQVVKVDEAARQAEPPIQIRTPEDQEREVAREDVRIFAILLDDYHVRLGSSMAVREPLTKFIEQQIAPTDLVGLMYPLTPVTDFALSRNREGLVRAVNHFEGRKYNYEPKNDFEEKYAYYPASTVEQIRNEVTLSALRALVTHLGGLREGRKAVILVSEGFTNVLPPSLNDPIAAMPGVGNPNRIGGGGVDPAALDPRAQSQEFFQQVDILSELRDVYDAANRANTSIYTLDPRGLSPFAYDINEGVANSQDTRLGNQMRDTLIVLANETDGRAIVNQNDLAAGLRQVVRDSSAYYLLGYSSTRAPNDGKFHEIKVRVKRKGLQIRARKGYWAYTADDVKRATASATAAPPPPEYQKALASTAAPKGRQIRTWIGTSRTADGKTRLTFSWEPTPSVSSTPPNVTPARVALTALSPAGQPVFRGAVPATAPTSEPTHGPQAISFDVPPGAVQLRFNIQNASGAVLDSDSREITVPDYTKPEVQLSTSRVFRARTIPEVRALKADPDAPPTATREFSRSERLLVRVQAYAPGGQAPTVAAKLLNRVGKPMADVPIAAPAAQGGYYEAELPLSMLATGEYLIEITASAPGGGSAKDLIGIRVTS